VLLDSGLGNDHHAWDKVVMQMGTDPPARVCSYDRRGLGRSSLLPKEPRTNQMILDELRAMLQVAMIEGPYVLVGHSMAGYTVHLFAAQHPEDVAGVVMVDSSHPEAAAAVLKALPPETSDESQFLKIMRELNSPKDPMQMAEYWDDVTSADLVRAAGPFGDIPLVILTRDMNNIEPQLTLFRRFVGSNLPAELVEIHEQAIVPLQAELTELSTNSIQIIVEDTSHLIPLDRPDAIVDAILLVMEMAEGEE